MQRVRRRILSLVRALLATDATADWEKMSEQNHAHLDKGRLFLISNLSIFMIGLGFSVRANIAPDLQSDIYNALDLVRAATMVGEALGATFLGFAFTLLFGSALLDWIGMKVTLLMAAFGFIAGSGLILAASMMPVSNFVSQIVFVGLLLTGLGWGAVEAASNPLVTTIYPDEKTHRLNILHAWWPAGIVVGGLSGLVLGQIGAPWQANLLILIAPALVMAIAVFRAEFPVTERVASGVSGAEMFREIGRQPLFVGLWICMWGVAASELAPGQWVEISLSHSLGMSGIWVLIYVSSLMFVMRHFAGPIVHRISSMGLMWLSALLAACGLYALSLAEGAVEALFAATLWGAGVCFMWPTMLATVSERFPRGGAFFLGLMGFAGGMAIQFLLPFMGAVTDRAKLDAAGGAERLAALTESGGAELEAVLRYASVETFQMVAWIPVMLLPLFGVLWWRDWRRS